MFSSFDYLYKDEKRRKREERTTILYYKCSFLKRRTQKEPIAKRNETLLCNRMNFILHFISFIIMHERKCIKRSAKTKEGSIKYLLGAALVVQFIRFLFHCSLLTKPLFFLR